MKKRPLVILAIVILVLALCAAGVFFAYEKHRVKPLFSALPCARDAITKVRLRYDDPGWVELSARQREELCLIFEDCSVKFWSGSNPFLANFYASAMVNTNREQPTVEIMFSTDGHVAINNFRSEWLPTYTIIDGGDALYQYLGNLEP